MKNFVCIFLLILFYMIPINAHSQSNVNSIVSIMAEEVNSIAPKTFDLPDGTRQTLLFASAKYNKLTYHYKLHDADIRNIDQNTFKNVIRNINLTELCPSPLADLVNKGVDIAYSYVDKNDKFMAVTVISLGDCK
ncbi:hypothetical protein [Desulfonatronum thioautotrophicum]|uniref:hypothetical protein n=1 Tax=Desulfonatronum thioautotrophicum TaxID=617001 RepID=UPI0012947B10|nr:hypothetical protein [Desulfonatronum thioautotrophicum]